MEVTAIRALEGLWQGTALLSHLRSATQYEAKVSSRNDFGYSEPKLVFNFATKGAGTVAYYLQVIISKVMP